MGYFVENVLSNIKRGVVGFVVYRFILAVYPRSAWFLDLLSLFFSILCYLLHLEGVTYMLMRFNFVFSFFNCFSFFTFVTRYYSLAHAVNERVIRQPSMLRAGTLRDYQLVCCHF